MATLSSYILGVRRLLHDATGQYWSDSELTDYINTARNRIVSDTGCNRLLQAIQVSQNIEAYSFGSVTGFVVNDGRSGYTSASTVIFTGGGGTGAAGTVTVGTNGAITAVNITNGGSGYTSAPTITFGAPGAGANVTATVLNISTFDVINVTVVWGSVRIPLDYMAFTKFNRDMRGLVQFNNRPCVFSTYGQTTVYIGPIPDISYPTEWDTVITPVVLVNLTDVDTINFPYTDPVIFYAAYLAKFKEGEMTEADRFRAEYFRKAKEALGASFTRRIPTQYGTQF